MEAPTSVVSIQQPDEQPFIPKTISNPIGHLATSERIPTTTWGPFTIVVVVSLVLLTCFILNCNRIRRRVDETRMNRLGRTGSFSFESRHKQLQEADLEWNSHPPIVYTQEKLTSPESTYASSNIISSSKSSTHSAHSGWSSNNSTIAQSHHYHDINFIKNQPPSVQLRLTLENASRNSLSTYMNPKRPVMVHPHESEYSRNDISPVSSPLSSSSVPTVFQKSSNSSSCGTLS
ncbi:uncharacterized protein B0P05DRAFT_538519 [Gilbertella persicaria]|uniref:uncharacterized protein n=1 Tax=Gilbertella persicaria TaxID=101096 RepID=UPI00221FB81C|nr:uncharacterized protein B0P05DRAFT_538519 [Gilbertella persicaria]KAI8081896.1 hypothetical protein B0P05DRAFT_538519 [Gilbertella persicaria]